MNAAQMWLMSLLPSSSPIALAVTPDIMRPGLFTHRISDMTGYGRNYSPDRRIVLLVDSRTQSASEYLVMQMQCSPQVTTVGSTTAGADGNVVRLSLPGDFVFQIGAVVQESNTRTEDNASAAVYGLTTLFHRRLVISQPAPIHR